MSEHKPIKLMAHLVAGFPSIEDSLIIAEALASGGADYLELQFPFSDPSADGKPIQAACSAALEAGIRVADGFTLVEKIRRKVHIPVFIMSYASPVYSMGVERFVKRTVEAGAEGLIVPDLMPGSDEGLYEAGRRHSIAVVPVITPSVSDGRLEAIAAEKPEYIYCALRSGITGDATQLDAENIGFLRRLRDISPVVMAGFGIQSREQVDALASHADVAIAGSVFVREIQRLLRESPKELYVGVRKKAAELVQY
ncbi:MAG: tryptophan synthase subunit alpha [Spirochaetota bacterium]|nr:tryptophan synthase subunit alpha [Spirochaetota bacterium]